jgi:hypothetical protein
MNDAVWFGERSELIRRKKVEAEAALVVIEAKRCTRWRRAAVAIVLCIVAVVAANIVMVDDGNR